MKKIPVYVNPYDKVHFGPSTVMTLHRFGIFDPDVARRVPTLSPFSAKLTARSPHTGKYHPGDPIAWLHTEDSNSELQLRIKPFPTSAMKKAATRKSLSF